MTRFLLRLAAALSALAFATVAFAQNISIATGGTGGVYYPMGGGLAAVLSKYVPGMQATAEVTGGLRTNAGFPVIAPGGVVNSASLILQSPLAPGSLVSILGSGLALAKYRHLRCRRRSSKSDRSGTGGMPHAPAWRTTLPWRWQQARASAGS